MTLNPAARGDAAAIAAAAKLACTPEEALQCILAATQELNGADDLQSGLRGLAQTVRRFLDYTVFGVLLLDERGRELRFVFADGVAPEVVEHWRFGLGQGLVGSAALSGETIVVADVAADRRYIRAVDCLRSEIVVPLRAKGRVIGVLDVGSARPAYFDREQERLLGFLADHLANALETARLHQNTRELARGLSLLHELSRELVAILDRDALLARVAERVRRIIDYDVFSVFLWSEERQLLEPALCMRGDGGEATGCAVPLPLGHGLCGTAAALRQPLRVPNVHLDPRYVRCGAFDTRSELVVPLVLKDRLLGVVDLESASYDHFSRAHEQLLATLASSLAIALENARLYEQVRGEEQRLQQDLRTARQIQMHLLPRATPWVPGLQIGVAYEPARHVGGDLYDFLPYGEGRLAVALGDVAGKATAAALYGSFAVAVLREHAAHRPAGPAQILADMSVKLRQLGFENRFLAMAFAVYDAARSTVRLANGGLPRPWLVRAGDPPRVESVAASGVPLGLLAQVRHEEVDIRLHPGDALVLLSDGIEETLDVREQELGPTRVREALARLAGGSAAEIAQGLLETARRFAGSAAASDDRTIVVLRRDSAPIAPP